MSFTTNNVTPPGSPASAKRPRDETSPPPGPSKISKFIPGPSTPPASRPLTPERIAYIFKEPPSQCPPAPRRGPALRRGMNSQEPPCLQNLGALRGWLNNPNGEARSIAKIRLFNPRPLDIPEGDQKPTMSHVYSARDEQNHPFVIKIFQTENPKEILNYLASEMALAAILHADEKTRDLIAVNHTFTPYLNSPKLSLEDLIGHFQKNIVPQLADAAYVVEYIPDSFPKSFDPQSICWQQLKILFAKAFEDGLYLDLTPSNIRLKEENLRAIDIGNPNNGDMDTRESPGLLFQKIELFVAHCSDEKIREYLCPERLQEKLAEWLTKQASDGRVSSEWSDSE